MPESLSGDFFVRLLFVLGVDLILAGDNAVVIALAVRRLEGAALHHYLEPLASAERLIAVGAAVLFVAATWARKRRLANPI